MRQIKFRAWDKAEKKMVRVNAIDFKNREFLEIECDESVSVVTIPKGKFPEHFILEQFAGLCDKNGKELYEGDKFKGMLDFGPGGYAEREGVVGFDDIGGYQWEYWDLGTIEVIGNIHDEEAKYETD